MYSVNGVCEITQITEREIGKKKIRYYVLKPVYNDTSTVFVPTDNENLVKKMKKLITSSQLDDVINDLSKRNVKWNSDDVLRKQEFRNIISLGNISDILVVLKSLWLHSLDQMNKGRKLHLSDEIFLKDAEKMVKEEISCVIGVDRDDIIPYIKKKIIVNC